jgi:hypothetical protein
MAEAEVIVQSAQAKVAAMKRQSKQRDMKVYFSNGVDQKRRKFISALLKWRYGISQRTYQLEEADVIIAATESEVQSYATSPEKLIVLPGYDLGLLRRVGDEVLHTGHTNNVPTLLVPPGDDWLINQFERRHYRVDRCLAVQSELNKFNSAVTPEQQNQIRSEIRRLLMESMENVDYVVVSERCGTMHVIIASMASVFGKPVMAEAYTPVLSAIVDYFVGRREDLIALVDAMTTMRGG